MYVKLEDIAVLQTTPQSNRMFPIFTGGTVNYVSTNKRLKHATMRYTVLTPPDCLNPDCRSVAFICRSTPLNASTAMPAYFNCLLWFAQRAVLFSSQTILLHAYHTWRNTPAIIAQRSALRIAIPLFKIYTQYFQKACKTYWLLGAWVL